jgi:uncharacterized membrane-anchored protein
MNNKKIVVTAYVLIALVQLYVPAKMILDKEHVLETGKTFKFKTTPIDPSDPFRGKYITLHYDENTVEIAKAEDWVRVEIIYVSITTDAAGFGKIKAVSKKSRPKIMTLLKQK